MEEQEWERYSHDEQPDQNFIVARAEHQQREHTNNQDYEFGGDDVCQDRPNEKSFFTFEERAAFRAVMSNVKGTLDQ